MESINFIKNQGLYYGKMPAQTKNMSTHPA